MLLDSRSKDILHFILTQYEYVSLGALMKEFDISRRTTYYAIQKVNAWLSENGIAELEIERNKGIFLTNIQKHAIQTKLQEEKHMSEYVFSPLERIYIMICLMIVIDERITLEYLMNYFLVSRNTIISDLKKITKILKQYHLCMTNETKKGYQITGDAIKIRAVFFLYINMLDPFIKNEIMNLFDREDMKQYCTKLKSMEAELQVTFVEGTLETLAMLLPLMQTNAQKVRIKGISHKKLASTQECCLVKKYFPSLSDEEACYLTLHLLGSRLQSIPSDVVQYGEDEETRELTRLLVNEFKRVACVEFENQAEIERTLFAHLHTSLYRYKYGIQLGNPMMEEIMNQYAALFAITKKAAQVLSDHIGTPIPDSEIAYLTLHFGGFLRAMKTSVNILKILLVCPNGVSTGNMLKAELQTLLPNATITAAISSKEFMQGNWECDLIVSTIPLKTDLPLVVVHPIMTDVDRIQILKRSMSKTLLQNRSANTKELFQIVKKYVDPGQYKNLYSDLESYIVSLHMIESSASSLFKSHALMDFLDLTHVAIVKEPMGWEQAIHYACRTLLEEEAITENYCASIIAQLQKYGPYMFITPDVVLAHAKSEDGANQLACSLVVFQEKVVFAKKREAKIILVLSTPDAESHLAILQDINQIFSDPANTEKLCSCMEEQAILEELNMVLDQLQESFD